MSGEITEAAEIEERFFSQLFERLAQTTSGLAVGAYLRFPVCSRNLINRSEKVRGWGFDRPWAWPLR